MVEGHLFLEETILLLYKKSFIIQWKVKKGIIQVSKVDIGKFYDSTCIEEYIQERNLLFLCSSKNKT